jgi:hypothetical protein
LGCRRVSTPEIREQRTILVSKSRYTLAKTFKFTHIKGQKPFKKTCKNDLFWKSYTGISNLAGGLLQADKGPKTSYVFGNGGNWTLSVFAYPKNPSVYTDMFEETQPWREVLQASPVLGTLFGSLLLIS